jgi:peptidyl-prolyl cis-trans isomerase D
MGEGEARVIEAEDFIAVVRLDRIVPAPTEGEDAEALRGAIAAEAVRAIAADAFSAFTGALSTEAGITLDQSVINAVNTSLN